MSAQLQTPNGNAPTAPSFSEAPASATLRVVTPTGYEVLLTTRAGKMFDLLGQLATLESWLSEHQWAPASTRPAGKPTQGDAANSVPTEPAPLCDRCGQPMVKRQRRDGSGTFWSCGTKYADGWCKGKPSQGGQS